MKKAKNGEPRHIPIPGQRITRSMAAVLLCFCVYFLRGCQGIPFYSALAVLQCMQPYRTNTWKIGKKRLTGTAVGAVWGLVVLLIDRYLLVPLGAGEALLYCFVSFFTGVVLYSTVLLKVQQSSYFSCVVFLSITVNHITDANPYLFVWNRVLDTLIGVVLALIVNNLHLPREKRKDTLFVSGVDDTMVRSSGVMTPYSKVELNRLIDEGAKFTVSTNRTPATLRETLPDIRWKLPVIAMNGAVLYDMAENSYVCCRKLDCFAAAQLLTFLKVREVHSFVNSVVDDMLVISYDRLTSNVQEDIYRRYRKSPYRNYICREWQDAGNIVYLLLIEKTERMEALYRELQAQPWWQSLRAIYRPSERYEGYSYMKIYDREATRENMLRRLQELLGLEKVVTFGSIPGKYDILVQDADKNTMVRQLKRLYEPVKVPFFASSSER